MKWVFLFFILLIVLSFLVFFSIPDSGSVIISWLGYEIRFSAIVGVCLLLLVFFVFYLSLRGLAWLLENPFKWIASFGKIRAKRLLLDLLCSYEAEIFSEALDYKRKIGNRLLTNPFFLWFSGLTLEKSEKHLEAEMCFIELIKNPASTFLGLKGQIRASLHRRDFQSAYDLLLHAKNIKPSSPWVLKHLLALSREQKKFKDAETFIRRLEDLGYFTAGESKKQLAYLFYQEALSSKPKAAQKEGLLKQAHNLDPMLIEAASTYALFLREKGQSSESLHVLEKTWSLNPNQKLGDLYLDISAPSKPIEAYQLSKKLTKKTLHHPESLLFLARTALHANLWGEARAHLTELLKIKENPTAQVYQLFANLELAEHKDLKEAIKWLEKGIEAPRDTLHP